MTTVDLIQYLDEKELNSIKSSLDQKNIPYIVKRHGGESKHQSYYYKIAVSSEDVERAAPVARQIKVRQKIEKTTCPKCNSAQYRKIENLSWLQKLRYSGTIPVKCRKCGESFVI